MMPSMFKTCLVAMLLTLGFLGLNIYSSRAVHAQSRPPHAPLRKSWGELKNTHVDFRSGETWLVFEDSAGTIRTVRIFTSNGAREDCPSGTQCADVISELRRQ
jgi:hypothetical protein